MTNLFDLLPLVLTSAILLVFVVFCWIGLRILILLKQMGSELLERLFSIESRLAGIEKGLERASESLEREPMRK